MQPPVTVSVGLFILIADLFSLLAREPPLVAECAYK
jgi:hypothetical protein